MQYIGSGDFAEATFENWESEFLQMDAYVLLTTFLFQKGSAESKDPDEEKSDEEEDKVPLRGWRLILYENSPHWLFSLSSCFHQPKFRYGRIKVLLA